MPKVVKYFNLTGGLNTAQDMYTMQSGPNRTETPDCLNVEYLLLGGIKSMEGNIQYGNTLDASVTLGYEYILGNNKYMIITTSNGKVWIFNEETGEFDTIYTFPNSTTRHSITAFNFGIVITNGIDDLIFYQKGRHELQGGTVSGTSGSTTLTGTDTHFQDDLHPGDYIEINDVTYIVDEITSQTELTLKEPLTADVTNADYYLGEFSELRARFTNSEDKNIDKPIRGLAINAYQGRLWVGGNDSVLYASALGLPQNWDIQSGAVAFDTFYNDSSDFSALGTWSKYLVIHKKERTFLLDGSNSDTSTWSVEPRSDETCDSQQSFVNANNCYYIYSKKTLGIYPLFKRTIFDTIYQADYISTKIKNSFDYVNQAMLDKIFPVFHPKKKYIMFYMSMLPYDEGSSTAYIYDMETKSWLLRRVPQNVTIAFRFDNDIYIGTQDGKIFKEFVGGTFDGAPINFYWRSPWLTFGDGSNYLTSKQFRFITDEEYNNDFYVAVRRDGYSEQFERRHIRVENPFNALVWDVGYQSGDFTDPDGGYPYPMNFNEHLTITDTVWDEDCWVRSGHAVKRFPLRNQFFNSLQISFEGDTTSNGLAIYGFELHRIEYEEVPL